MDFSSGQPIYFVHDGHGSVRELTNPSGAVTDTYDYDAFGNLLHSTGTTTNNYLFAGEQFDPNLNLYYNRARYLSTNTGRFWSMDTYEGNLGSPVSLHKYLYAGDNPVGLVDPSGNQVDELIAEAEDEIVDTATTVQPQVAATATTTTAADSVAVAAQLKDSLIGAILLVTILGTSVFLKGDNPTPTPNSSDDSANRGSLQVQGQDIAMQGGFDLSGHPDFTAGGNTVAWPWHRSTPLLALEALTKLSEFLQILTPTQIGRRGSAFRDASQYIKSASDGGGVVAPVHKAFNANDQRFPGLA